MLLDDYEMRDSWERGREDGRLMEGERMHACRKHVAGGRLGF